MGVNILPAFNILLSYKNAIFGDCSFKIIQDLKLDLITLEGGYKKEILFHAMFLGDFQNFTCLLVKI